MAVITPITMPVTLGDQFIFQTKGTNTRTVLCTQGGEGLKKTVLISPKKDSALTHFSEKCCCQGVHLKCTLTRTNRNI